MSWSAFSQKKSCKPNDKLLRISVVKKMLSHTLVALVELAVEETKAGGTTLTRDLVDDELDGTEVDTEGAIVGVLGEVLTDEDEGVVAPPAVPEAAALRA